MRLPTVLSEPYTAQYPLGNSAASIELGSDINYVAGPRKVAKPPTDHFVMTRGEYNEWRLSQLIKQQDLAVDCEEKSDMKRFLEEERLRRIDYLTSGVHSREQPTEVVRSLTPDTPELVENPMTKSVHVDPSLARALLVAMRGRIV